MNNFFIKLDRFAAWILMAVIIVYAVSGYGMTKGLIDLDIARSLHLSWLGGIGITAFVIHTFRGIYLSFLRWRIWNKFSRFALILVYCLLACFFLYIHFFYNSYEVGPSLRIEPGSNSLSSVSSSSVVQTQTVYTSETLAVFNGLNGQPAYAAVNGIVYDVSSAWRNGDHHGYSAGVDLTDLFYSQHQASLLNRYPVVGTYQK